MACTVPHSSFITTTSPAVTTVSTVTKVIMSSLPLSSPTSNPTSSSSILPTMNSRNEVADLNNSHLESKKRCRSHNSDHHSNDHSKRKKNQNDTNDSPNIDILNNIISHNQQEQESIMKRKQLDQEQHFLILQPQKQQEEPQPSQDEIMMNNNEQELSTEQIHSLIDNVNIPSLVSSSSKITATTTKTDIGTTATHNHYLENDYNHKQTNENNTSISTSFQQQKDDNHNNKEKITSKIMDSSSTTLMEPLQSTSMSSQVPPQQSTPTHRKEQLNPKEKHKPLSSSKQTTSQLLSSSSLSTPSKTKPQQSQPTPSSASTTNASSSSGRWTNEEHEAFLHGLKIYGREWKKVAQNIPTRTSAQIRSHAQKYFAKLAREDQNQHLHLQHQNGLLWCSGDAGGSSGGENGMDYNESNTNHHGVLSSSSASVNSHELEHQSNLPQSVLGRVDKILKDPEGAQLEVEQTLQKLRERYNELQQKVREKRIVKRAAQGVSSHDGSSRNGDNRDRNNNVLDLKVPIGVMRQKANNHLDGQVSSSRNSGTMTPMIILTQSNNIDQEQQSQSTTTATTVAVAGTTSTTETLLPPPPTTTHRLRDDLLASKELIALHVLGGELYRSGSQENLKTTATSHNDHNNTNNNHQHDNNDSSDEDKDDTTKDNTTN